MNEKKTHAKWRRPETELSPGALKRPVRYAGTPPNPDHYLFIEKLCLALIKAHPPQDKRKQRDIEGDRRRRLLAAIKALTDFDLGDGRAPTYDLATFFKAFCTRTGDGEVRVRPQNQELRPFYNVALTYLSIDKNPAGSGDDNPFDDASGHSDLVRHRTRLVRATGNDPKNIERLTKREDEYAPYISSVQTGDNSIEESEMFSDLKKVEEVLARWDIDMSVDALELGFASLWDETA